MRTFFRVLSILVAALLIAVAVPNGALAQVTLRKVCPFDGQVVEVALGFEIPPRQENSFDDLGPLAFDPLVVCPASGFIFYKKTFTERELEVLKPFVFSNEFSGTIHEVPARRAAWLAEKANEPPKTIVWLLYQAYEGPDTTDLYGSGLATWLPAAILSERQPEERVRLERLLGEVQRRLGRFDDARASFIKLLSEIGEGEDDSIIAHLEIDMIDKHDRGRHLVPNGAIDAGHRSAAWLAALRPIPSRVSRFSRVVHQFSTYGGQEYLWDETGHLLELSTGTLRTVTMPSGNATNLKIPHCFQCKIISPLPKGDLLLTDWERNQENLIEIDPTSGNEVWRVDTPSPMSGLDLGTATLRTTVSYDAKFTALHGSDGAVWTYSFASKSLDRLNAFSGEAGLVYVDDTRPLMIIGMVPRVREYAVAGVGVSFFDVWDYEKKEKKIEVACGIYLFDCIDAVIDSRRDKLYMLFSHDGGEELRSYDLTTGQMVVAVPSRVCSSRQLGALSLSRDGSTLLSLCGGALDILDIGPSMHVMETIAAPRDARFKSARLSPDGRYLAVEINDVMTVLTARSWLSSIFGN